MSAPGSLSSKLEYFQRLDKEAVAGATTVTRRQSGGLVGRAAAQLNGDHKSELEKPVSNGQEAVGGNQANVGDNLNKIPILRIAFLQLLNRSLGAIASFALGETAGPGGPGRPEVKAGVTPLSRLPGQDLTLPTTVQTRPDITSTAPGIHTAQVAQVRT